MRASKLSRFAFAAQYWDDCAVVCRAVADRPGPILEPRFGVFDTWTRANALANRLNQRLQISRMEACEIISHSLMLRDFLIHSACKPRLRSPLPPGLLQGRRVHLNFVRAQLQLALTFCNSAQLRPAASLRILRNAQNVLREANLFILRYNGDPRDLDGIASSGDSLAARLRELGIVPSPSPRQIPSRILHFASFLARTLRPTLAQETRSAAPASAAILPEPPA